MPRVTRVALLAALFASACSVGDGEGDVRGRLMVAACNLQVARYSMQPDFFAGDWHEGTYTIRISQGGASGEFNDELVFLVDDTRYVAQHLNERIPVGPPGITPVHATLRLSKSCGSRELLQNAPNVALSAVRGYIVFEAVYRGDPNADAAARRTTASSFSLELEDPRVVRDTSGTVTDRSTVDDREPLVLTRSRAEIEGRFDFYFSRGRPAQRFQ
jgi:hypothetical protein